MGLDIWFAEDIRNALLAANEASAATAAVIAEVGGGSSASPSTGSGQGPSTGAGQGPSALRQAQDQALQQAQDSGQTVTDSTELLAVTLRAYREGYKAALATVALAFGIAPQTITLRQPFDFAQDRAQDEALRPFDCAQDMPLDELRMMQAQDKALRIEPQNETPRRGGEREVTYLSPKVRGS